MKTLLILLICAAGIFVLVSGIRGGYRNFFGGSTSGTADPMRPAPRTATPATPTDPHTAVAAAVLS